MTTRVTTLQNKRKNKATKLKSDLRVLPDIQAKDGSANLVDKALREIEKKQGFNCLSVDQPALWDCLDWELTR